MEWEASFPTAQSGFHCAPVVLEAVMRSNYPSVPKLSPSFPLPLSSILSRSLKLFTASPTEPASLLHFPSVSG